MPASAHFNTFSPGPFQRKGDLEPSFTPPCLQLPTIAKLSHCLLARVEDPSGPACLQFLKMSGYVEPKPGDLIEISRVGYQHWAIYVGSGYVIHLAPSDDLYQASTSSLMSVLSEKAVVKKELLWSIVGNDACRINNKYDQKYEPLPANKIVQEAEALLGKEIRYSLASENCEHFVTRLRYGMARSDQVRDTLVAGTVGLFGVGLVAIAATVVSSLFLPRRHREE